MNPLYAFLEKAKQLGYQKPQVATFLKYKLGGALQGAEQSGQGIMQNLLGLKGMEGLPKVTQVFGQKSPYDVFSKGINYGVDFASGVGTPVFLPQGTWKVIEAFMGDTKKGYIGNKTNKGYGNSVLVQNTETGEKLRLSHLSKVGAKAGQMLRGGIPIAMTGSTGNVTGPHLDVEYRNAKNELQDVLRTQYAQQLFKGA